MRRKHARLTKPNVSEESNSRDIKLSKPSSAITYVAHISGICTLSRKMTSFRQSENVTYSITYRIHFFYKNNFIRTRGSFLLKI